MAYSKLQWLAYSDQALGFQTINQAQDNLAEHLAVMQLRHGLVDDYILGGVVVGQPVISQRIGRHNDVRIPRSMQYLSTVSVVASAVAGQAFGAPTLAFSTQNAVVEATRISVGVLRVRVIDFDFFFANPVPVVTSAGQVRRVLAFSEFRTGGRPGVFFQTHELDGGNVFQPTDFDFSFALYGTT